MIKKDVFESFKNELEKGWTPDEVPEKAALEELKPFIIDMLNKNYSANDIAKVFSEKLGTEITSNMISAFKPKPKNGSKGGKPKASGEDQAPAESETDEKANDTPSPEKPLKSAAPKQPPKPAPVKLENVQEWREKDGIVILKDATPVKAKTRILTESGKIAEVVSCRPTTYGSGFSKHDGMEVTFQFEKE